MDLPLIRQLLRKIKHDFIYDKRRSNILAHEQIPKIRGGFSNVPVHLKTKTELNKMGLKAISEPVAEVWNSYQWCKLYDLKDTKEKKKLTENQLNGVKKARLTREENERHRWAEEERQRDERQRRYGLQTFGSWYEKEFVILDTETTHLDGEIIEISIIDRFRNVLFDSLVKPKNPITEEAYNVNGISNNMVATAPTWPEVFPKIKEILSDKLILIYNDQFDCQMINNSCYIWGLETINLHTFCVMRSYSLYYDLNRWVSLQNASGNFVSHRALDDCLNTLKVIEEVWNELGLVDKAIK
jgi:DNA polymerase III subunit epsilon